LLAYKSNTEEAIKEQIILEGWKSFLIMMAPITPHITAELWKLIDKDSSFLDQPWPSVDKNLLKDKKLVIAVQINGKLKNTIEIEQVEANDKELQKNKALALYNIKNAIINNTPKKIIVIPGKVINIVI
jgi:leucyl-tRNA synthetase